MDNCILAQIRDHSMVIQALDLSVSLHILNERVPCDDLCLSMILYGYRC